MDTIVEGKQEILDSVTVTYSKPMPIVKDEWPGVEYQVTVERNNRRFTTSYSMGIGHFKSTTCPRGNYAGHNEYQSVFNTYRTKGQVELKDKNLAASYAAAVAVQNKITPDKEDVLLSLSWDSNCDMSFDDWAIEYDCDTDSRKAELTYKACQAIRHEMKALFSDNEIDTLGQEE